MINRQPIRPTTDLRDIASAVRPALARILLDNIGSTKSTKPADSGVLLLACPVRTFCIRYC
jgi:hypothetical protein